MRSLAFIYRLAQWLCFIFLAALVLLTVLDVSLRSAINQSIWGASELSNMLLALSIGAGFYVANNNRSHITIDIFHGYLRRLMGHAYQGFVTFTQTLGVILYAAIVGLFAYEAYVTSEITVVLEWPLAPVFGVITILLLVSSVFLVWPYQDGKDDGQ